MAVNDEWKRDMKKKKKDTENYLGNNEILVISETKCKLMFNIRKGQLEYLRRIMREEFLANLILTRHIQGRKDRGKYQITYLQSFINRWLIKV